MSNGAAPFYDLHLKGITRLHGILAVRSISRRANVWRGRGANGRRNHLHSLLLLRRTSGTSTSD